MTNSPTAVGRAMQRLSVCALLPLLASACFGQDSSSDSKTYAYMASGRSFIVLGAEDSGLSLEAGAQRIFHEPKRRKLGGSAYSVYNLYPLTHIGQDGRNDPAATLAL